MTARSWLRRLRARALGADLAALHAHSRDQAEKIDRLVAAGADHTRALDELAARLAGLEQSLGDERDAAKRRFVDVRKRVARVEGLAASARDDIPRLRHHLAAARAEPGYERAYDDPEPLVSVRIASYQNTDALMDVALDSVFAQTYPRFEVVIVNDGPNDATRRAVEGLKDARIRYLEFSARRRYPDDAGQRWLVAGSPGMNEAARLSVGDWIAPLDDDDAFSPDHIEVLLALARETRAEVAYGAAIQVDQVTGTSARIHSFPPERGGFTFQAALVHQAMRFVEYDEESWRVGEPGDWNVCRRMLAAGVRFAARDVEVATLRRVPFPEKGESAS